MKVMIVVTHLLGTGHLARALTLARAFAAAGDVVRVVSGGSPVPHFDTTGVSLVQLPPVRSDGTDFTTLLDDQGAAMSAQDLANRADQLVAALAVFAPDVLITELFPFGRRILRDEFRQLLAAAHNSDPRPLLLSSIRDILAPPSKPAKVVFADEMVAQFYDGVLVHSDPSIVPLSRSWPVSDILADRLHYTGFVAPAPPPPTTARHGEVLVSTGGGSVGDAVFDAAIAAARNMPDTQWRFLVGGGEDRVTRIADQATANVRVEGPRPDFRTLLQGASASISMCGYNTALDVLQTGVPAVLIPFDDGGEVEQRLRADALAALPAVTVLRQDSLSGTALAKAVAEVTTALERAPRTIGMQGATETVEIVRALWAEHR
ncbi:glycosyltransferase family protein [Tateyamaria sp. SN3-11]|uniref:glycosyltransferase family protein n=1 Tax=Tateyamaria sp. SN3-11 TaxID=3092147 RepID=UPI0039EBA787